MEVEMRACNAMVTFVDLYREWIERYRHHLEIIKNDHELIIEKGFEIFFAVDFYDIHRFCFPYSNTFGRISDYKEKIERKKLMELHFARSFLFYGTEQKSKILLPPYVEEFNDFFIHTYSVIERYQNDSLKQEVQRILFQEKVIQDVLRELEGGRKNLKEEIQLLVKITESSSDILFLLSSGFLEGISYNNDVLKEIAHMDNRELEKLFSGRRKYLQNRRDAKALQYVLELNKRMKTDKQVIFLVSSAKYMRYLKKRTYLMDIGGEKYNLIRDLETFYVYLIEVRDIFLNGEISQMRTLKQIERSLEEFTYYSRLCRDIPKIIGKCIFWNEKNRVCDKCAEDECPFSHEIKEINKGVEKVKKLKEEIENINLMKQIDVILSPLFSEDKKRFLRLPSENYEDYLVSIFNRIRELIEDRSRFFRILEELENELEDQRLKELFSISVKSLSIQEPFMSIDDVFFLIKVPFRLHIIEKEFQNIFNNINQKAINCVNNYLSMGRIDKKDNWKLNKSLRELARLSGKVEGDNKYIIWQIVFLCNKRFDLVRIWNEYYRNQIESKEMKRESDYLLCLACYYDILNDRDLFKLLQKVFKDYAQEENHDLRFYYILSLALLRLFENSSKKEIFGYTREDLIDIFESKLIVETDMVDGEFKRTIMNNYCYAVSLMIDYSRGETRYKDRINEIREIMENMKKVTKKWEWQYDMEDTLGYIYFLLAKYFEKDENIEYARKAKDCLESACKFYLPHKERIRSKCMKECDKMLA